MQIRKAVILAGGRGERVKPITNFIPKALIPIHGIPILAQQLRQLERLGFNEVLILTGYLSESIEKFCDGFPTTLAIRCISSDPNNSPAERLIFSKSEIGSEFLLIYCDNLILEDDVIQDVLSSPGSFTFLIEERETGNIAIRPNETLIYHPGEKSVNHKHVELGNIKIESKDFFDVLEKTQDLPSALGVITKMNSCNFVEFSGDLLSISNFDRFLELEKQRLVLILDRDGVLLAKMPKRKYLTRIEDYQPLYENWKGLLELTELGIDFVIATNQPGVALGEVDEDFLLTLHQNLVGDLVAYGVNILAIYVCPHHWDVNCECRKPMPGMLLESMNEFKLNPLRTLYIGDDDRDQLAANGAGIPGILIGDGHSNPHLYPDIAAAIPEIKSILKLVG
jgi:D-glycero-D-manno-heptose 1,7-bisphosphate phosphatase